LSQWRAYGHDAGYAIGLAPQPSLALVSGQRIPWTSETIYTSRWAKVLYDPSTWGPWVDRVVRAILAHTPRQDEMHNRTGYLEQAVAMLWFVLPYVKNSAFADEHEVRQVFTVPPQFIPKFRAGRYGITPYVEVANTYRKIQESQYFLGYPDYNKLPVRAVTLGPTNQASAENKGLS
jgi:hypothetical protein